MPILPLAARPSAALLGLCLASAAFAQAAEADSLRHYWLRPITVEAARPGPGQERVPLGGAPVERALEELGVQPLRRGAAMTGDVVAGAFKRGDVEILIDGERHPNACPNRMDNASTRLDPAGMASLELMRSCCTAACGLGGVLEYHRRAPSVPLSLHLDLQASALAATDQSLALAVEKSGLRLSGRTQLGSGYSDGDGREFQDNYPYAEEADYKASEGGLHYDRGDWSGGASYSLSEDIPFPYLLMDERETKHLAGHVAWRGQKLYFNRTDHLMDNGLRTMNGAPLAAPTMVSDADNTILGLSGEAARVDYHASLYKWDLRNHFNTPMGRLENHMIPDLTQLSVEAQRGFELGGPWSLSLRAGVVQDRAGDGARVSSIQGRLYANPDDALLFVTHGLALQWRWAAGPLRGALLLESASDDPALESLWIGVQKPGGKPWWIGNPELKAAMRQTLRGRAYLGPISFEAAFSRVADYAERAKASFATSDSTSQVAETWQGVDADLVELQARYASRFAGLRTGFVWGRNLDAEEPLSEISPFFVETTLNSPRLPLGATAWVRHVWTAPQRRVSATLAEAPTGAWNRIDLGLETELRQLVVALELENLLDHEYAQHLSYLRNPFGSGQPVMEPGRALRLRLSWTR